MIFTERIGEFNLRCQEGIYYCLEDQNGNPKLSINCFSTSFAVGWSSNLSMEGFLRISCNMIDKLASKKIPPRRILDHNPASVTIDLAHPPSFPKRLEPSYFGFLHNIVYVGGENTAIGDDTGIPFELLEWPLNMDNISEVVRQNGGQIAPLEKIGGRINAPTCTTIFRGDRWGNDFAFWSHVLPLEELIKTYKQTCVNQVSERVLDDLLPRLYNRHAMRSN